RGDPRPVRLPSPPDGCAGRGPVRALPRRGARGRDSSRRPRCSPFAVAALLLATIVRRLAHGAAGARWPGIASASVSLLLLLALPAATAAAAAVLLAGLLIVRGFRR
ncbi:hypothetical protein, partial [Rathayibacter tanaceti]|uniref:hypothetical protein n=1 Tax=Rathayibacter tanaceti TaxID=1671680 RepID=UPI001F33636B